MAPNREALACDGLPVADSFDKRVPHDGVRVLAYRWRSRAARVGVRATTYSKAPAATLGPRHVHVAYSPTMVSVTVLESVALGLGEAMLCCRETSAEGGQVNCAESNP